jgi:DNA-binding transcriptional LysR family regulator
MRHAEAFEQVSDMVERDFVAPDEVNGCLRIGASETTAQCWLPEFVCRVHAAFPNLRVEIDVDISPNLRGALLDRQIDLAFLLGPVSESTVDNIVLPDIELSWYASASMVSTNPDPAQYLVKPIITFGKQTRPYRELKAMLLDRVGPGVSMFPSSSLSACFRLVEAGLGVAALPVCMASPFLARGTIVEFDPGWRPNPLRFTASFLSEPRRRHIQTSASMALDVATRHARRFSEEHGG